MTKRRAVYTCVFGGYDRVYPPVRTTPGVDHFLVCDDADLRVDGWQTVFVDPEEFGGGTAANRHFKMNPGAVCKDHDTVLYIDGNIRLLDDLTSFFEAFEKSGAGLGAFHHRLRSKVSDEAEACIAAGKVKDAAAVRAEVAAYEVEGFPDNQGLIEAGVSVRNLNDPKLLQAMQIWGELYEQHRSRDQLSLPVAIWKSGVKTYFFDGHFALPNPLFALYPHVGASHVRPGYAHVVARSHDSLVYRLILSVWHLSWTIRRWFRS